MTAITRPTSRETDTHRSPGPLQHIVRVTRLQFVDLWVLGWTPAIIIAAALLFSIAIALIIVHAGGVDPAAMQEGMRYSWAVLSPIWYLIVVGVQAVATTLQFALGIGATRRDYWLGTTLAFTVFSAVFALAFAALRVVELATGGWGTHTVVFDALWYHGLPWWLGAYATFTLSLTALLVGAALTTCYMRWRVTGVLTVGLSLAGALLAAVAVLTWLRAWPALIRWFAGLGVAGIFSLVLAVAALAGAAGYLVVRRATPR